MSNERKALIVLPVGFALACLPAAIFSGTVLAPVTAMPLAAATGMYAGFLLTREP
jgi:hypothetical protein